MKRMIFMILFVFALFAPIQSFAVVVIDHIGSTDPTTEGWTKFSKDVTGNINVGGTETISGTSHDFWKVTDNDPGYGNMYIYDFNNDGSSNNIDTLNTIDFSGNWYFEASARVTDGNNVPGMNVPPNGLIVADGQNYWSFYLGDSLAGPVSTDNAELSMSTAINNSDYNTYAIQYSSLNDTADFFINGSLVFDDVGRSSLFSSDLSYVGFGGIASEGIGSANYEYVFFDDGKAAPVPEPSTYLLLGAGIFGLALYRRKIK